MMASTEVPTETPHIDRQVVGTAAVITVSGAVNGETVRVLSAAVLDSGDSHIDLLVIDVEQLEAIDRDGLLGLAEVVERVRRAGIHAVLGSAPPGLQSQIEAAGLADHLPVAREGDAFGAAQHGVPAGADEPVRR
jgi:anti-anti-sigma factor